MRYLMPFEIFTIQFSTEEPSCSCYAEQQHQRTLESDQGKAHDCFSVAFFVFHDCFSLIFLAVFTASQQDENPKSQLFQNLVKTPNFHSSGLEKIILRSLLRNWIYQETDPLNLPSRVTCLSKLERVFVMNCIDLLSISEFPSCSKEFYALHFTSMERL